MEYILASSSPRRKQLLADAGYNFQTHTVKVSEIIDESLNIVEALKELARQKAEACRSRVNLLKSKSYLILSADTVVVFKDCVLGKPVDRPEARKYLQILSGKTHSVMTSICLIYLKKGRPRRDEEARLLLELEVTEVKFKPLAEEEIEDYLDTDEPYDKAGAYAIQGIASKFVESFKGSRTNVIGLPMELLESVMRENGWLKNEK